MMLEHHCFERFMIFLLLVVLTNTGNYHEKNNAKAHYVL